MVHDAIPKTESLASGGVLHHPAATAEDRDAGSRDRHPDPVGLRSELPDAVLFLDLTGALIPHST